MELRQFKYFVRIVELGSIGRAALDFGLAPSALSQQMGRLESELCTRLLNRTNKGATPTDAGMSFFREAQLALRHAEEAIRAAKECRISGSVSIGLAPTTAAVLGIRILESMRNRYPSVRLHLVESLTGHLSAMLNSRKLDMAVLFDAEPGHRWSTRPLLDERLFLISSINNDELAHVDLDFHQLSSIPLILPSEQHGLRGAIDLAFTQNGLRPNIIHEIDSLAILMDAVDLGIGSTIQPWAAIARYKTDSNCFALKELNRLKLSRRNTLCMLSDDELSPAALAACVVLEDCVRDALVTEHWRGAEKASS
jgi:LysR family tcuABC transcriptional regulator